MNREISFRGKRTKTVEWVYGLLWHNNEKSAAIYSDKHDRLCWVKPETVGQFAGLTDKNGKRIFEGDIAKRTNKDGTHTLYEVVWDNELFAPMFQLIGSCSGFFVVGMNEFVEVIGNIHDNPELLNGTES